MLLAVLRPEGISQGRQGRQTLIAGVGVHGQPLEGKRLRLGQQVDRFFFAKVGKELVVEPAGILGPGRNDQGWNAVRFPQCSDIDRPGPLTHRNLERLFGQRIDLSVHAAVNNGSENHLSWYIGAGVIAKRKPQFPTAPAKDGTLVQVMPGLFGQEWGKLVALLDSHGMAEDLTDPRYEDRAYRAVPENQAHINEVVAAFIATGNADDLFHAAQENGVVWAPIRLPHENVGDPHMTERGCFAEVDHPEAGVRVTMPHAPWVSDELGWRTGPRAPRLGEHTEAILAELGESAAGIEALRRKGAV